MTAPLVSVVIPTRNGLSTLPAVVRAIKRQRVAFTVETIAVDSGSTDGTVDFLKTHVDQLVTIGPEEFDHGRTRNLGLDRARGELLVLLVQDAEPASEDWLAALVDPLIRDGTIAGTFARQLPRPGASPLTRHYLARWRGGSERASVAAVEDVAAFHASPPLERLDTCTFDNVCSCIRRRVWQEHPFASTAIAEDLEWARTVLLRGHKLAFVPQAQVLHSHDRTARYELARTYVLHRRLFDLFGVRTIPTLVDLVRAVASSLALHLRLERSRRAVWLAFAWPVGQYLGGLAAARRWPVTRIGGV